MAENLLCVLARDSVSSSKFTRYVSFIEGSWSSILPVDVVGYVFSRFVIEECDLHWILAATSDPRLPARIPIALRHQCNIDVGYLGSFKSMLVEFAVNLTTCIKDDDSLPTMLWADVLTNFVMRVLVDFTGARYTGGGAGGPFTPTPPRPPPSWKLVGKCRAVAAKRALRKICLMRQRIKKWFFAPCVYTQNTRIFHENSIMDEKYIGLNINTIPERSFVMTARPQVVKQCLYD